MLSDSKHVRHASWTLLSGSDRVFQISETTPPRKNESTPLDSLWLRVSYHGSLREIGLPAPLLVPRVRQEHDTDTLESHLHPPIPRTPLSPMRNSPAFEGLLYEDVRVEGPTSPQHLNKVNATKKDKGDLNRFGRAENLFPPLSTLHIPPHSEPVFVNVHFSAVKRDSRKKGKDRSSRGKKVDQDITMSDLRPRRLFCSSTPVFIPLRSLNQGLTASETKNSEFFENLCSAIYLIDSPYRLWRPLSRLYFGRLLRRRYSSLLRERFYRVRYRCTRWR